MNHTQVVRMEATNVVTFKADREEFKVNEIQIYDRHERQRIKQRHYGPRNARGSYSEIPMSSAFGASALSDTYQFLIPVCRARIASHHYTTQHLAG